MISNKPQFMSSLYVDELQVAVRHVSLCTIEREMQQYLNNIHQFTTENGFRFSQTKKQNSALYNPAWHPRKQTLSIDSKQNNTVCKQCAVLWNDTRQ